MPGPRYWKPLNYITALASACNPGPSSPGQVIAAHVHPHGQDTWTIVSGSGRYQVNAAGDSLVIGAGDIVVAPRAAVHGVHNSGTEPLVFVSVVCPAGAGYSLV